MKRTCDQNLTVEDFVRLKMNRAMTGGGCTALSFDAPKNILGETDNYIMITNAEGCCEPETWLCSCIVGFYRIIGNEEQWDYWECTFEEFVEVWYEGDYS